MISEEQKRRICDLVSYLNRCSDEYYNTSHASLSDAQYDALFDELTALEAQTGYVLPDSPTVRVGYEPISELTKVIHEIPLLSLAKTKSTQDLADMAAEADGYLGLKMDGLTVKLTYVDGQLVEAATRGDGNIGEDITHNARTFVNVPLSLPTKQSLCVTGEAYIDIPTFERINEGIDDDNERFSTPRNLAAGSVRQLDPKICKSRHVRFMPFQVLSGMESQQQRIERLKALSRFGFDLIPHCLIPQGTSAETIGVKIKELKEIAEQKGYPIDGIVFSYNDAVYSAGLGRTAHHFKDGIAYKFSDPHFKTTLNAIQWQISRTGQLTPVAVFCPVEIDGTLVEKASLHNITFIEGLKLHINDQIMVSKRNMIIPHVEQNLSIGEDTPFAFTPPSVCPVCGQATRVQTSQNDGRLIKVLYCSNEHCPGRQIKKFTHFVSKPAMNIDGLSEQTLSRFLAKGWLHDLHDLFHLSAHRKEIATMDGFGEKSADNLITAIEAARTTHLSNLLVALNIGLIGKSSAQLIEEHFSGDARAFFSAIRNGYDLSVIDGFGSLMSAEVTKWFSDNAHADEFLRLIDLLTMIKPERQSVDPSHPLFGKTVVITGTFERFTRDELADMVKRVGGKVTGSVSKKTDYLLCGEAPGSKLTKAQALGIPVLSPNELPF